MNTADQISSIIFSVSGKKAQEKRVDALVKAGFKVSFIGVEYNFGKTGTIKEQSDGSFKVQLGAAKGITAKNGYSLNKCDVYTVSQK